MNSRCVKLVARPIVSLRLNLGSRLISVGTNTSQPSEASCAANCDSQSASPAIISGVQSASARAITRATGRPVGFRNSPSAVTPFSTGQRTAWIENRLFSATSESWVVVEMNSHPLAGSRVHGADDPAKPISMGLNAGDVLINAAVIAIPELVTVDCRTLNFAERESVDPLDHHHVQRLVGLQRLGAGQWG